MSSLQTRARRLQKKSGRKYQQCLDLLRQNSGQLARLATQSGWPPEQCDDFLEQYGWVDVVDPNLDLARSWTTRFIEVKECDCGMPILYGVGKKGDILTQSEREPAYCHQCRGGTPDEELSSCGKCGAPGTVLREGGWCEDCNGYMNYVMSRDD